LAQGIIYLLKNQNGAYYFGSTNNLARRFNEHNQGKSISTRSQKPWHLATKKEYENIIIARRLEQKMKSWKLKITEENFLKTLSKCENSVGL